MPINTVRLALTTVWAERARRQHLDQPLSDPALYWELVRLLQPVAPPYYSQSTEPPTLKPRTAFEDSTLTEALYARHQLVKGRYLGGMSGFVLIQDVELYSFAFGRPLLMLDQTQQEIYDLIVQSGPLTAQQIREATGMRGPYLSPVLQRLEEAFLIYETKVGRGWERGWYSFAQLWPHLRLRGSEDNQGWEAAAAEVVARFLGGQVFLTASQLKSWTNWPEWFIPHVLKRLEKEGRIIGAIVQNGYQGDEMEAFPEFYRVVKLPKAGLLETRTFPAQQSGWILAQEEAALLALEASGPKLPASTPRVSLLHKGDSLVRMHLGELEQAFGPASSALHYLLIDGWRWGVVKGQWQTGPYPVQDIVVDLPPQERAKRLNEIVASVAELYQPPDHPILRYEGEELE